MAASSKQPKERINVVLPRDLAERFRRAIADVKGIGKGNISESVQEAIELWLREKADQIDG